MIRFELVALDGIKFSEEVYEVVLPTPDGYIGVFPSHMPLISLATPGIITVRQKPGDSDKHLQHFATNGGVIEIGDNTLRVLVDEADHEDAINEQEVEKAYERAQALRKEAKNQVELDQAQTLVDRQAVRLQVAGLKRRKRR